MAFAFKPTNANSIDVAIGVDYLFDGYIIQNFNESQTMQNLEIADQKGRTCQVIAYDKGKSLSFTMIGPDTQPFEAGNVILVGSDGTITVATTAGSGDYIIQSCERACTYNDTAKWNVQAIGWEHASYYDKTEDEL